MKIHYNISALDDILECQRAALGDDIITYRNHCYRAFNYCCAITGIGQYASNTSDKIAIAVAFHDLGIWTYKTFDYPDPSQRHAPKRGTLHYNYQHRGNRDSPDFLADYLNLYKCAQ